MKREQAEEMVRLVNRTCRGRRTDAAGGAIAALLGRTATADDVLQWSIDFKLDLAWLCMLVPEDQKLDVALPLRIRTKSIDAAEVLALFDEPTQARIRKELLADPDAIARAIDSAGRRPCGSNVNDLILAQPLDGEEHAIECPGCRQLITWTAPLLEIDPE